MTTTTLNEEIVRALIHSSSESSVGALRVAAPTSTTTSMDVALQTNALGDRGIVIGAFDGITIDGDRAVALVVELINRAKHIVLVSDEHTFDTLTTTTTTTTATDDQQQTIIVVAQLSDLARFVARSREVPVAYCGDYTDSMREVYVAFGDGSIATMDQRFDAERLALYESRFEPLVCAIVD